MLRVSDNPPSRWPEERSLLEDLGQWWVARVKPRNEKALAWELLQLGVSYYLPMFVKRSLRRDSRKPRKSVICTFPGYLSLAGYQERKTTILRTGRVLQVIRVGDQEKFVRELEQVRKAMQHAHEVAIQTHLAVGRRVVIVSGPLQGVEGIVIDLQRPKKIFLNVEIFNRAVSVTVSPDQLSLLENSPLSQAASGPT